MSDGVGSGFLAGLGLGLGLGLVGGVAIAYHHRQLSKQDEHEKDEHEKEGRNPSAEEILGTATSNFKKWNDALQTKDPKEVASLYSTDSLSFLPTVSHKHIRGLDDTEDYFKVFCAKEPWGTITDESVVHADNGSVYLHSGLYTFELGPADSRTPVQARFSFLWKQEGNDWKIAHHHSSVRPCPPPPPQDMHAIAAENFNKWNQALQTKESVKVAALYASSGLSFLPTVSHKHIKGPVDTQDYFKAFVQKNPFGTITDDMVQTFDNGKAYLHSGNCSIKALLRLASGSMKALLRFYAGQAYLHLGSCSTKALLRLYQGSLTVLLRLYYVAGKAYLHSGNYTFLLGPSDHRTPVQARFSYVWKKEGAENSEWKIYHHHSSVSPA